MYIGITIFLLNTFLGLLTIYKKRTLESVVFGVFACSFGLWALGIYSTLFTGSLFWGRTTFFGAITGLGSLFLFSNIFPGNRPISTKKLLLIIFLPVLFCVASYTNLMLKNVTVTDGSLIGTFGSLIPLYKLFAPLYFFGSIYTIFKNYKSASYEEKNKIGYAFLGILLSVGPAVATNVILPLWFKNNSFNGIGPVFSIFMVIAISYAIIRHEFLDIKVIIQKGLIYSTLLTSILGMYLGLLFTFEYIFNSSSNTSILISAFITTLVGIFGVPPLKGYFQKITDKVFFKGTYDYVTVLRSLTDALNTSVTLESIIEKTSQIIQDSLKAETVIFSLKNKKVLHEKNTIHIPIKSNKKNIGLLIIGEKRSGDPYTKEDMNLLETFAKQAGTALEKADLYTQVKEYAKTLEAKVEARTQEILNIQKEQESMMLEISHGLQTPLTIMKGELFLLKKQGHDTARVDSIDTSIDRISTFIYRFLSLSRLETASTDNKTIINLSLLLQKTVSFFEQEATKENIALLSTLEEDIIIQGNNEELEELFSNLISNSIKYMTKVGTRNITVMLSKQEHTAQIIVQDTGIGIREENLKNLFKKFYRVKETETKGIQGTGLGLVICKKIVEMHGGIIHVESIFEKGTKFEIIIPLKD